MSKLINLLLYIISSIVSIEAARILAVFPVPSFSHQVVFRHLTHELAKRGHEVIVITPDPAFPKGESPENLTEIDVHDISYKIWREEFMKVASGEKQNSAHKIRTGLRLFSSVFMQQLKTDEVQNLIRNKKEKFDLLLLQAAVRPALVFSYFFKVPVIQVSSMGAFCNNLEAVGAPTHPLIYGNFLRHKIYNLTFWEKILELYSYYSMKTWYASQEEIENKEIRQDFGHDIPPLSELSNNVHMLFLNIHPLWDENRPVPPNVIYMGGIQVQKPKKNLPKDLEQYLNSSVNGVIYISFGTNVNPSLLAPEKIQVLLTVFSQLPYDVLWKWDTDELPGRTKNIKISKWFPQSDLLRHPRIKLFITQAGLQSTDESIIAGVPLIAIPMLSDQWYNAEKYVHYNFGIKLDFETLTVAEFKDAIETVINDTSYRHNIVKFREQVFDRPQRPLDRAVWWTEHVLRHGGARHLRTPFANITWHEYLELDIVFTFLLILLAPVCLFSFFIYYFLKSVSGSSRNTKVDKKMN